MLHCTGVSIIFIPTPSKSIQKDDAKFQTYKAIAPALPVPSLRLAFEAVLFARPASVQALMAAVSAAVNEAAFAPPVPSLVIATIASADMVREDGAVTPARTVATFVVLRTEADVMPRVAKSRMADVFMIVKGIM